MLDKTASAEAQPITQEMPKPKKEVAIRAVIVYMAIQTGLALEVGSLMQRLEEIIKWMEYAAREASALGGACLVPLGARIPLDP